MVMLEDVHLTLESPAGPVNILKGISLEVDRGEAVGVVGPSGSGKSTLLAVIAGLERASRGRMTVAGQDLSQLNEDGLALFRRDNVGIVFQSFHLIPTLNALENVAMPLELAGRRDAEERAMAEMDAVGLHDRISHYPAQLSGGEQQRVALARALVVAPKIMLADEPTGNLDGETGRSIVDLVFAQHAERDTTLLLITHDPALADRCDRIITIADGRIEAPQPAVTRGISA